MIYGVPFSIEDLKTGHLSKTVIPTPEQKFLIEWAVYTKSQMILAGELKTGRCGYNVDQYMDHTWGLGNVQVGLQPTELALKEMHDGGPSINQYVERVCSDDDGIKTGWTTYIRGFSFNPIQPTHDELFNTNGLRNYYLRGGYLLRLDLIHSKLKIDSTGTRGLRWNVGYALCPDLADPWWSNRDAGNPTDANFAAGGYPIPVSQYHPGDGKGWNLWLYYGDGVGTTNDGHYTISATPTDIGAKNKILGGIATVMDKAFELICDLLPYGTPIAEQQLLKETCVDASNKTCAKGSPGCTCTPPPTAQKDGVAIASSIASRACQKRDQTTAPTPPPPAQLPVDPVPQLPPASGTLPAGAITAFSSRLGMWRIAIPREVGSKPPYQEIAPSKDRPTDAGFGAHYDLGAAQEVTEPEFEKLTRAPFYKRPLFWAAVAGGVAVVGGGSYYLVRRRRRSTALASLRPR